MSQVAILTGSSNLPSAYKVLLVIQLPLQGTVNWILKGNASQSLPAVPPQLVQFIVLLV